MPVIPDEAVVALAASAERIEIGGGCSISAEVDEVTGDDLFVVKITTDNGFEFEFPPTGGSVPDDPAALIEEHLIATVERIRTERIRRRKSQ